MTRARSPPRASSTPPWPPWPGPSRQRPASGSSPCRSARPSSTDRTSRSAPTPSSRWRVASAAARASRGVRVAPAVAYGSAASTRGSPGRCRSATEALELLVLELCRSPARTFAGGVRLRPRRQHRAGAAGVATLRAEGSDTYVPARLGRGRARRSTETSLMLALAPGLVRRPRGGRRHEAAARADRRAAPWRPRSRQRRARRSRGGRRRGGRDPRGRRRALRRGARGASGERVAIVTGAARGSGLRPRSRSPQRVGGACRRRCPDGPASPYPTAHTAVSTPWSRGSGRPAWSASSATPTKWRRSRRAPCASSAASTWSSPRQA